MSLSYCVEEGYRLIAGCRFWWLFAYRLTYFILAGKMPLHQYFVGDSLWCRSRLQIVLFSLLLCVYLSKKSVILTINFHLSPSRYTFSKIFFQFDTVALPFFASKIWLKNSKVTIFLLNQKILRKDYICNQIRYSNYQEKYN